MSEYPYPLLNEKGKVVCQICGKPYLVISPRHLGTHNIKYDEYKLRFPNAPLSSEEFIATSKYGKDKTLFVEKELEKFEYNSPLPYEDDMEEIVVGEDPEIDEDFDLTLLLNEVDQKINMDPMTATKNKILDHLKIYFTNIEKDYLLEQYGIDNKLKFQFITDFCDPVLKIVIQFPKAFWHNKEIATDLNKKLKLESYKWKVIEINYANPSLKDISKTIEGL